MSQEKVDAYKKEKKGRKARLAKHKRNMKIAKGVSVLVLVAVCGFAGWRVYASNHQAEQVADTEISEDVVPTSDTAEDVNATAEDTETTEEAASETTDDTAAEAASETTDTDATAEDASENN